MLTLDNALYSETDFQTFNPEGYRRVQEVIRAARDKKTLAITSEEMREAAQALQSAADLKNQEQRRARQSFERLRQQAFGAISGVSASAKRSPFSKHFVDRVDHLITLFNMKEFHQVVSKATKAREGSIRSGFRASRRTSRKAFPLKSISRKSPSASALFYQARTLDRQGDRRGAREHYEMCLERNPRHVQALAALARLSSHRN